MNTALWIVQGLVGFAFLMAGAMKLFRSKEQLRPQMGWVEGFAPGAIKAIGLVEVLGAVGVVVPWATGILPVLTPLAAAGLVVTMVGAAATHLRRHEGNMVPVNAVLGALAAFVAWGRFAG